MTNKRSRIKVFIAALMMMVTLFVPTAAKAATTGWIIAAYNEQKAVQLKNGKVWAYVTVVSTGSQSVTKIKPMTSATYTIYAGKDREHGKTITFSGLGQHSVAYDYKGAAYGKAEGVNP